MPAHLPAWNARCGVWQKLSKQMPKLVRVGSNNPANRQIGAIYEEREIMPGMYLPLILYVLLLWHDRRTA
jgi:hypothetical protein